MIDKIRQKLIEILNEIPSRTNYEKADQILKELKKELKQEYREEVKKMIEDYDWCYIHTTMHYPTCGKCKVRFDIKKKLENL